MTLLLPSPRPAEPESEPSDGARAQKLEAELREASQELVRVHSELVALRERLRRHAAERSELIEAVSHELRTPLTVIGGYHRLLLGAEVGPLNEQQRRFLEESHRSCQRLEGFLANMLVASHSAHGDLVLAPGRASLAPAIESVAAMFEPLLAERDLRVAVALDPDAGEAHCDLLRVEQVLANLVGNAVKFTRIGGVIEITTRLRAVPDHARVRRWVEVSVSDDGPGVAPEHRERVFESYVQIGPGQRAGGIGLGLAISRRIVEAHGGEIRLSERDGGGCRFSFTLPAEPQVSRSPQGREAAAQRGEAERSVGPREGAKASEVHEGGPSEDREEHA